MKSRVFRISFGFINSAVSSIETASAITDLHYPFVSGLAFKHSENNKVDALTLPKLNLFSLFPSKNGNQRKPRNLTDSVSISNAFFIDALFD